MDDNSKHGIPLALAAYGIWGLLPIYLKLVSAAPADIILVHRIIWSLLFCGVLVVARGRLAGVLAALRNPAVALRLLASSILIAVNWLVYIWAVNSGHILESALGYFITPLVNVLFGMLLFGERMAPLQWLAVALAATGITLELVAYGSVPVIALALATTFGLYGVLRKQVAIEAQSGLLLETAVLAIPAALYWLWFADAPTANMANNALSLNLLLLLAGPVTAIPLICFAAAARRLPYSTLGMFQYIAPTLQFAVGVLIYAEPLGERRLMTFGFIWAALAVFSVHLLRRRPGRLKAEAKAVVLPSPEES